MKKIYDIFSKSSHGRDLIEKKLRVIVDYREKSSRVPALLSGCGFGVEFRELKVGDYIINDVVIERKDVRDLVGSIVDRRVMKQLTELSQAEKKFLFIEGNLDLSEEKFFGINSNAVRGFILSIGLRYKIPIIFTKNFEESVKFMKVLANKKEKSLDLNFKKRARNKKEEMEFVLEGFSGIGPVMAKKLLLEFGSLNSVFGASCEELEKVIGKKGEVFRLLREKY